MKEKIFALISSSNIQDNMIGYNLLKDKTLENIKSMWILIHDPYEIGGYHHDYWRLDLNNTSLIWGPYFYQINNALFVHTTNDNALFCNVPFDDWNGYTIL